MNKWIFVIPMFILFTMIVSAADADYVFKQNENIDLKRPCMNNGTWCSGAAVCTITIISPVETLLTNATMTNQGTYHNISVSKNKLVTLGQYKANMACTDSGLSGSDSFTFDITPSGNSNILGLFFIVIGIIYFISFFGFFGKHVWLSIVGGMGMIILGLYTMTNGIDVYRNFMTDAFSWITIAVGALFALTAGIELIQEEL